MQGWLVFLRLLLAIFLFVQIVSQRSSLRTSSKSVIGPSSDRSGLLPFILLSAWVVWSFVTGLVTTDSGGQKTMFLVGGYGLVLLGAAVVVDNRGHQAVARIIGIGFIVNLALSAILLLRGPADPWMDNRLTMGSLEPNQLGRVAALSTLAALWLVAQNRGIERIGAAALSVVSIVTVVATGSRTSVIGLVICVGVLACRRSRVLLAGLSMALVAMMIPLAFAAYGANETLGSIRFGDQSNQELQDFGGRSTLWPFVKDLIAESPITGVGLGNDRILISDLPIGWSPQHAHSLVFHLLLTTGFIGAALVLTALILGFVRAAFEQAPLAVVLITFVLVDGINEAVIRVPAFGWFAICAAALLPRFVGDGEEPKNSNTDALNDRSPPRGTHTAVLTAPSNIINGPRPSIHEVRPPSDDIA